MENHIVGRPALTREDIDLLFQKLEPFLKSGLPLYKACQKSNLPKSSIYGLYRKDRYFSEKVDACQNYLSNLTNNIIIRELVNIENKQKSNTPLNPDDKRFIVWFASNNNRMKEYYCGDLLEEDKEKIDLPEELLQPKPLETAMKVISWIILRDKNARQGLKEEIEKLNKQENNPQSSVIATTGLTQTLHNL